MMMDVTTAFRTPNRLPRPQFSGRADGAANAALSSLAPASLAPASLAPASLAMVSPTPQAPPPPLFQLNPYAVTTPISEQPWDALASAKPVSSPPSATQSNPFANSPPPVTASPAAMPSGFYAVQSAANPMQAPMMNLAPSSAAVPAIASSPLNGSSTQQQEVGKPPFVNHLKSMLRNGDANIYALNIRTFGAHDDNKNGKIEPELGESGTFLSCIPKLQQLANLGFNTLHVLPVNPVGHVKQFGNAGSLYATADYTKINPQFNVANNGMTVEQEMIAFKDAAHAAGLHVMLDVPSCAAEDLAQEHPELIAVDAQGNRLTPGTWTDIVAMENNPQLTAYMDQFFEKFGNEIGVDGFRCDVARFRSDEFWKHQIGKFPEKGWFGETYIEEDDSPIPNIPRDRPMTLLKDGFDTYYGQFHIFHNWTANEYLNYLTDEKKHMLEIGEPRAFTGTFYTHDDPSMMKNGGVPMYHLSSAMMALQPFTNPYVMDGYLSADPNEYNIFDYAPPAQGQHPEVGQFLGEMLKLKKENHDLLINGSFTPIPVQNREAPNQIISYTRNYNGKHLLVLANKDITQRHCGTLEIPNLQAGAPLQDLIPHDARFPNTGQTSAVGYNAEGKLSVDLEPGAIHAFFIEAPNLEANLATLYKTPEAQAKAEAQQQQATLPANNAVPFKRPASVQPNQNHLNYARVNT
jgi:glycosidase